MKEGKTAGRSWRWRSVVSLMTTWMFLVMGITGIVLYVVPQGRVAYWVDWRFLALSKTDWGNIHIVSSILFVISGALHVWYNWKPFLAHVRRKLDKGMKLRTELVVTTAAALLVTVSAIWHIPPLGYLVDLNELIKDAWVGDGESEPPFGHAELLSLESLSKKTSIDLGPAVEDLREAGYEVESEKQTLEEIAAASGVSPRDLYAIMQRHQKVPEPEPGTDWTPDLVFERFDGSGVGKKTLAEACAAAGETWADCERRLVAHDAAADGEATMKKASDDLGIRPIQLLQDMLVEP